MICLNFSPSLLNSQCKLCFIPTHLLHPLNSYWTYATYTIHSWQLRRMYAMYTLQTKSLRQDVCHVYVTCRMHAVLQCYFLTYPLFDRCFEFPSLSLSTVVHLTRAEYHNNSYSREKMRRCWAHGSTVQYNCNYSRGLLY